jgi:hypothetical protein
MKCILIYTVFTLALLCGTACQQNRGHMDDNNGNNNQGPTFSTAEEAANKAKADLLEVLRSGKSINLGLDSAAVSRSQPSTPLKQYQLTFDKLLSADSAGFANMKQDEKATVVPLTDNNDIVTIAEVAKNDKGWRVTAVANKEISEDLNAIRKSIGDTAKGEITIYNLPHTATKVYGVKRGDAEIFYTSYPGFSIRQGVPESSLLPLLRRDALEYRRKFGDDLKNQKLVQ